MSISQRQVAHQHASAKGVATARAGRRPTHVATVFGGGGVFGIAYNLGIAEAFVDAGIDLTDAAALGTSAGAWAAAHLALEMRFADTFETFKDHIPRRPNLRNGGLRPICREVFGSDTRCPSVRVGVVSLPGLKREVLRGVEHAIADLVAASCAVPGMLAPQRIRGVRYLDGGLRSMASADLGERAARMLVVLPMSGPMFGPAGRLIERRTVREIDIWRRLHWGSEVMVVRPTPEIAALVRRPDQLFDPELAERCYALAREQGRELAAAWATSSSFAA